MSERSFKERSDMGVCVYVLRFTVYGLRLVFPNSPDYSPEKIIREFVDTVIFSNFRPFAVNVYIF